MDSSFGCGRPGNGRGFANKPKEYKFHPQTGGNQGEYYTYETVKDHLVRQIQKTFMHGPDIASLIENMQMTDLNSIKPVRIQAKGVDAKEIAFNQATLDMDYNIQNEIWVKRKNVFDTNKIKAYTVIYDACSLNMQNRITEHPEFDSSIEKTQLSC